MTTDNGPPTMPTTLRFLAVGFGALLLWGVLDYAHVTFAMSEAANSTYADYAFAIAVFAGFLWASQPLFVAQGAANQAIGRILIAALGSAAWALLVIFVGIPFHLAIGGGL